MSTPAASTKSVASTSPDAQNATVDPKSPTSNQNGADQTQEHDSEQSTGDQGGYPEQKHAGAVGIGPEYGKMREAVSRRGSSYLVEFLRHPK